MTDQTTLPADLIDGFEAEEPGADFADRVMHRLQEPEGHAPDRPPFASPPARPRRSGMMAWLAVAAVLLLLAAGWLVGNLDRGGLLAAARETVAIGRRAVAVAEPGAALRWRVSATGQASIEQDRGAVFYRVASGGAFIVHTSAGNVAVRGTCFRVEVTGMGANSHMHKRVRELGIAASAGALLSGAVLVSVYEGQVVLENRAGRTVVSAGQVAAAAPGQAPSAPGPLLEGAVNHASTRAVRGPTAPPAQAVDAASAADGSPAAKLSYAQLQAAYLAQREELARLEQRGPGRDDGPMAGNEQIYPPDRARLLSLAERCGVQVDMGPILKDDGATEVGDEQAQQMGLSPAEREAFDRVVRKLSQRTRAVLLRSYLDLGGSEATAREVGPWALYSQISRFSNDEQPHALIAQERAGLVPPPDPNRSMSPKEEAMRWVANLGDTLQEELAKEIGAERAHAIRARNGGWIGGRSTWVGCGD